MIAVMLFVFVSQLALNCWFFILWRHERHNAEIWYAEWEKVHRQNFIFSEKIAIQEFRNNFF